MQAFTEDEVVNIVSAWLVSLGAKIESSCNSKQKGVDIVFTDLDGRLNAVEAKGGRSGRVGSSRYGKNFTSNQIIDRVMKGFYTCAALRESERYEVVFLAIPRSTTAERYLFAIRKTLQHLKLHVLFVESDGNVTLKQDWS